MRREGQFRASNYSSYPSESFRMFRPMISAMKLTEGIIFA